MEQYLHFRGPQQTKGMRMLVCRACLTSEVALHNIYTNGLSETLANIIGVPIKSTDDMPPYICDVCVHLLRKFERYRAMCRRAMQILQRLQLDNESETHQICNNQQQEFLNFKPTVTKIISFKPERPLRFGQKINIDIFGNEASQIKNLISYTFNPDDDKSNAVFVDKDCGLDAVGQIPNETNSENNEEEFKKRKIKTEDNVETKVKVKKESNRKMMEIYDIIELAQVNPCENKRVKNNIKKEKQDFSRINCKSIVKPKVLKENPKRPGRKNEATSDGAFARRNNVEVKCLTKEEQKQEMEALKKKYEHFAYQCQMCYRGYSQQQTYATHMLAHDPGSGEFECDICGLRWKTSRLRNRHRRTRHKYIFICKACGKKNYTHATTKQHFFTHSQKAIRCEICDKAFKKKSNYFDHIRKKHKKNSVACQICREGFTGNKGVNMHMHFQHKQAKQCNSCNMYFENKAAVAKHLESSITGACVPDISPCYTCGEGFNTAEEAIEHGYQHVAGDKSACSKCNKLIPSARLSRHWKTQHSGVPKPRKKHSGLIPTQACNVQSKSFMCETCGRALQSPAALRAHKLLHTGEKPHRCTYCPKTFRLKSALNIHLLGHTDERPYHCEFCPKAFRQASHLIGHIRIHTLEKPFECDICHKTFTLKANMRIHVKTVHEGMPPRRKMKNK